MIVCLGIQILRLQLLTPNTLKIYNITVSWLLSSFWKSANYEKTWILCAFIFFSRSLTVGVNMSSPETLVH